MKDYEAFECHCLDHWIEQGYIQADTFPSGKGKEGEPMKSRSIEVIRYQIENMNTREVRIFRTYKEALDDYESLEQAGAAHGCWRIIALLKEMVI